MFRASPENVAAGRFRSSSRPSVAGFRPIRTTERHCEAVRKTDGVLREQAREFEVQDRPPPQGQPVGPSEEPDQQARIRSRPAWPGSPEADRLSPAVDGEAAPQGLLRLGFGAPAA